MSDYVLLYQGGSMPETDEERAKVMEAWTAWFTSLGAAVKDQGNPFSGQVTTIAADGAVSEGGGGGATGYSILSAGSIEEATTLAKDCPVFHGGASLMVFETLEVM